MKLFSLNDENHNFGDMISKPILEYLGIKTEPVNRHEQGKILAVGSILTNMRRNDIVWGAGLIRGKPRVAPPGVKFLAIRGQLSRKLISNAVIPEIYGDPSLLLPLFYKPKAEKKYKIGLIPHYVDKNIAEVGDKHFIDIQGDWQTVIEEINSCERIISSSLHGMIVAEAYGIPACWVRYSNKIKGGNFKFHDYLLGTERQIIYPSSLDNPIFLTGIDNIGIMQQRLINAAEYLKKINVSIN